MLLGGTVLAGIGFASAAGAADGTWLLSPPSNQWINGANWTSNPTVPNGTATFGASNTTNIAISSAVVETMQINAGAPAYTFTISGLFFFGAGGLGIVNNSSNAPSFTIATGSAGTLAFLGATSAGNANINISDRFASVIFLTSSTASNATITNNGLLQFSSGTTAGSATITTNAGGLGTFFLSHSSGGQARFITNAGAKVDFSGVGTAVTAGSIEGAGTYFLGANRLTVGSNNLSTEVSGVISDGGSVIQTGGSLAKVGNGTLTLSGTNAYTGATTVDAGSLIVNGSIAASSGVTVNSGTILGGSGTVSSTTINDGGTLAPGNSIGTLTVQGSLVFSTAATYLVEVSPTSADRTNVSGIATLGGTVNATFAPGDYLTRSYTILSATGGRSGTFGTLATSNLPTGFVATLGYTATDVTLNLTAALPTTGLAGNQQNVAGALSSFFNNGGALPPGFVGIFGLTGPNLANALSQLSGEAATGAQQGSFQLMNQFLGLMLDPFVEGRGGIGGGPAVGFGPERTALPPDIAAAYASVLKAPPFEQRWGAWGSAYGGYNRTKGDAAVVGSHDLTARAAGVAAGLDYRVTPDTVLGFSLAGGGTSWGLADGLGGGKSEALQAGVYGATRSGPLYAAAALAYASHWMSTDRFAVAGDHLTADFNAQSFGARVEGGYRIATPVGAVMPYAAAQTQYFRTSSYSETDVNGAGFALSYNARSATATRSELGARFDHAATLDPNAALVLRGRLAWAHDWVSDPSLTAVFQALPGASFIVNGASPAKDSALASAGAELRFANGVTLGGKFDGEFARKAQTYAGSATVRVNW
jgi:autotransporter-associated beta strand protein